MASTLAGVISEIVAAANEHHVDEIARVRALAEAPDIRLGELSVPAIATMPDDRVVAETLRFAFDFAVRSNVAQTTQERHGGKAGAGMKAGLLGIGAGIAGELCRDETRTRSSDTRARIHVEGTLERRELPAGLRLIRDTAIEMAAIKRELAIRDYRQRLLGDQKQQVVEELECTE